jgi:hypothetical protein
LKTPQKTTRAGLPLSAAGSGKSFADLGDEDESEQDDGDEDEEADGDERKETHGLADVTEMGEGEGGAETNETLECEVCLVTSQARCPNSVHLYVGLPKLRAFPACLDMFVCSEVMFPECICDSVHCIA